MKLLQLIENNRYPGRGIVAGRSSDGLNAYIAYFIMGRSENSRNRVFAYNGEGIITKAYEAVKLRDPSLVIYAPVRKLGTLTIISNGDQTDTIYDYLECGDSFESALMTREHEPDAPHYTPRISALVDVTNAVMKLKMSILKRGSDGEPERLFWDFDLEAGEGRFLHTYVSDGDPLRSFEGEPIEIELESGINKLTREIWDGLDGENKISLFTRQINISSGEERSRVVNKHDMIISE